MGSYRNEDEALIGLARQLTDAYGEARRREDQDYACDSIADYLSEFRERAPSEALLAILDLPLTAETYPLVDEAQVALAARGPAVVGLLLAASMGEVYDPDGPSPQRAAETIGLLRTGEASAGLCRVLCADADGWLKPAAVEALIGLGDVAEADLLTILDDPEGGEWAAIALEQLRYLREHGDPLADEDQDHADEEPLAQDRDDESPGAPGAVGGAARGPESSGGEMPSGMVPGVAEGAGNAGLPSHAPAPTDGIGGGPEPDKRTVDDAYEEFRRRFERESGEDATTP